MVDQPRRTVKSDGNSRQSVVLCSTRKLFSENTPMFPFSFSFPFSEFDFQFPFSLLSGHAVASGAGGLTVASPPRDQTEADALCVLTG